MECPRCKFVFEKKHRSLPQNNSYWGLIVDPLARHLGLSQAECHDMLKEMFNYDMIFIPMKGGIVLEYKKPKSTTDMTTVEFEHFCAEIRRWASQMENPLYLQEPNEPPIGD